MISFLVKAEAIGQASTIHTGNTIIVRIQKFFARAIISKLSNLYENTNVNRVIRRNIQIICLFLPSKWSVSRINGLTIKHINI